MKLQKEKNINKRKEGLGCILIGIFIVFLISLSLIWTQRNTAVSLEERIDAQYSSNKSDYDSMWKKFKEITQVTDIQSKQIKDTYKDLICGRYNDSNVLFKMVQESNPQLNTNVYTELQREISASRNQFNNNQKSISDIVREYNTYVRKHIIMSFITGRKAKSIDLFIVTSEKTQEAFSTKKDDEINLLGK